MATEPDELHAGLQPGYVGAKLAVAEVFTVLAASIEAYVNRVGIDPHLVEKYSRSDVESGEQSRSPSDYQDDSPEPADGPASLAEPVITAEDAGAAASPKAPETWIAQLFIEINQSGGISRVSSQQGEPNLDQLHLLTMGLGVEEIARRGVTGRFTVLQSPLSNMADYVMCFCLRDPGMYYTYNLVVSELIDRCVYGPAVLYTLSTEAADRITEQAEELGNYMRDSTVWYKASHASLIELRRLVGLVSSEWLE